jgi:two-component system chemotaxis response regulator CheB
LKSIRVLVVDDSALMRRVISDMLNEKSDMEVIATARNGQDALEKAKKLELDIITLDVEMPIMNGIDTLKELKKDNINMPVIMLSGLTKESTTITMECLHLGAFDFIPKPSGVISVDINKVQDELVSKVRAAFHKCSMDGSCGIRNLTADSNKENYKDRINKASFGSIEAIVIGASTGGPKAIYSVITKFPKDIGVPIFVVQHMPVGFTKAFAERLDSNSQIKVVEAQEGQIYEKNVAYVAPGGFHMEVKNDGKIHLSKEPAIWGVRPAVDKLFKSASEVFKARIVSVVLTGMGKDGAEGTKTIKEKGGITISEDESTCIIYGMPKMAYETGAVDFVIPLDNIAQEIIKIVKGIRR